MSTPVKALIRSLRFFPNFCTTFIVSSLSSFLQSCLVMPILENTEQNIIAAFIISISLYICHFTSQLVSNSKATWAISFNNLLYSSICSITIFIEEELKYHYTIYFCNALPQISQAKVLVTPPINHHKLVEYFAKQFIVLDCYNNCY